VEKEAMKAEALGNNDYEIWKGWKPLRKEEKLALDLIRY
jgi:hypothetical protein